ncbi:Flagellar L-ring protein FlgH [hydrothermal vent metagenome]|uniref:Flagellar L-ring protein FlgH n=1 Tax=hydrothermal vent metagenome TaxID=652676 RepID=A0A3B0RLG6_9ZZZZ
MRSIGVMLACLVVSACAMRVDEIGRAPTLAPVGAGMRMPVQSNAILAPAKPPVVPANYSLWPGNKESIFNDQRAKSAGDVLTVKIEINDQATLNNKSKRSRESDTESQFGMDFFSSTTPPGTSYSTSGKGSGNIGSTSGFNGSGAITRAEKINLSVAAVITQVLPNGNYLISGTQEVRVNFELRVLSIVGIVRPEDVSQDNSVSYEKIAEARISYGGRGRLTEVQQPGFGQQIWDAINPF